MKTVVNMNPRRSKKTIANGRYRSLLLKGLLNYSDEDVESLRTLLTLGISFRSRESYETLRGSFR